MPIVLRGPSSIDRLKKHTAQRIGILSQGCFGHLIELQCHAGKLRLCRLRMQIRLVGQHRIGRHKCCSRPRGGESTGQLLSRTSPKRVNLDIQAENASSPRRNCATSY